MTARYFVEQLQLQPHPEGGYYKETYRSKGVFSEECLHHQFAGPRNFSTAIYFLLQQGDFSAFHRIKSDECWHFYDGGTLLIHVIDEDGGYTRIRLGRNLQEGEVLQYVVPAGAWFASEPADGALFTLVGCTVSPGFDFRDFEMAKAEKLLKAFPQQQQLLQRLCR